MKMKIHKGNFLIYLLVVIIPTILLGLYFYNQILKENDVKRKDDARWIASIYQKNWDQFVGETLTSLKILSLSAIENFDTPEKMEPLLQQAKQEDPRYSGLFLLDNQGRILTGTDTHYHQNDFPEKSFIKEAIQTKDIIISNHVEVLGNNQRVISLASPVLNKKQELLAVFMADLRIDYMKNIMRVLTPDTKIFIVDGDKTLLQMNVNKQEAENESQWITYPMNQLPWSLKVKIADRDVKEIAKNVGQSLFIIIIVTHVLFLLIEYILLRIHTLKERKENEIQKMELVGTLAASTAHEIRNPLTGVKGLIQLLSEKYTDKEDRYYFDVINLELKRINEIVSDFLILGKPTVQTFNHVNINETLNELKPLIISEGNALNIECSWHIDHQSVIVNCVKDQIKQVILNLTKNAFDSFESPGILQIRLQKFDETCKLEIIDSGKGIPEEDLEKIFRPFYTSKETGTGLGLVICKRIINSFGGEIKIKSKVSAGTTVEITLPLANKKRIRS
ncbi:PAS domain-containing sensor histidine kinase [Neobacillus mesonae]|uniref:PAS domain-containing sensor histidine kinase n=1 Tax=Neobacillus mesonae TaxID=1193713 RepID=UPI00203BFBF6|nr:PAS domain-containing sensor histidine kinase [Neobacillus mesonae]MCM3568710.1 ATP-binding protein [Neobacillus mesonae]